MVFLQIYKVTLETLFNSPEKHCFSGKSSVFPPENRIIGHLACHERLHQDFFKRFLLIDLKYLKQMLALHRKYVGYRHKINTIFFITLSADKLPECYLSNRIIMEIALFCCYSFSSWAQCQQAS